MLRINKYLSQCGVASRRYADILVSKGHVTVNGELIDTPGYMIDEAADEVCVDGVRVRPTEIYIYIVLNKPAGYITSLSDPHHQQTVVLLLKDVPTRVYPVGRLDLDTEGTLLFTNDGELSFRLTHPKYAVKRAYSARVRGIVTGDKLALFPKGIKLPDGKTGRAVARIANTGDDYTDLYLELTEGRKREVKHLCKEIGYPVIRLYRNSFGGISSEGLEKGKWRFLTNLEVDDLYKLVKLAR